MKNKYTFWGKPIKKCEMKQINRTIKMLEKINGEKKVRQLTLPLIYK